MAKKGSKAARAKRASEIVARLRTDYPQAGIVLDYGTDWELLVAVILSAQCTDKMVNLVTAKLFEKYRSIEDYASADPVGLMSVSNSAGSAEA